MKINRKALMLQMARKFLTQAALADAIGMTKENLNRLIQGHQSPSAKTCEKLCKVLEIDFDDLFILDLPFTEPAE